MFELSLRNRDFDVWNMLIPAYTENEEVGKAITALKGLMPRENELFPDPENYTKENVLNWASNYVLERNKKKLLKIESGKTKNEN